LFSGLKCTKKKFDLTILKNMINVRIYDEAKPIPLLKIFIKNDILAN
jgi:hypothetical protein